MKALILINAFSEAENYLYQPARLKEELEKLGIRADIVRNRGIARIAGGDVTSAVGGYGFCIYLDKDKYTSAMLERAGMRLFNSHRAIRLCDDKMTCHIALSSAGVRMPDTIAAPLCYSPGALPDEVTLSAAEKALGYPIVVKTAYGSLGSGVFLIEDRAALIQKERELQCTPHIFQKFIAESRGRDMRVIVIGGKCVAAMERMSSVDFRSNMELGGTGRAVTPPKEAAELAVRCSELLGLDYCGVDLLFGRDGFYVCEVNSNAFFRGAERVTGVNIAAAYAEYAAAEMRKP